MCFEPGCAKLGLWFVVETTLSYLFLVTSGLVAVIELNRGERNSGNSLVLLVVWSSTKWFTGQVSIGKVVARSPGAA